MELGKKIGKKVVREYIMEQARKEEIIWLNVCERSSQELFKKVRKNVSRNQARNNARKVAVNQKGGM